MVQSIEFIFITALALLSARFVRFLPTIAVQIIIGIILGSAFFGLNYNSSGIKLLADIGLFAIFFQVGLDFDLTAPELESVTPARSAAAGIVASFVLVFLFTLGLGNPAKSALLIALATVSTSVSVAIYSFLSLGPIKHLEAKVAVIAGLFDDLIGLTILAVLASILSGSLAGILSLFISLVIVISTFRIQKRLGGRSFDLARIGRYLLSGVLVVALLVLWKEFGLTLAIAGFVAGVFSGPVLTKKDQRVLGRISGLLGPLFLVSLGLLVEFNHPFTLSELLAVIVISLGLVISKSVNALVLPGQLNDRILYWFSMVPRAEVAGIGLVLIAPYVSSSLEIEAVISVVLTSLLIPFVISHRVKQKLENDP